MGSKVQISFAESTAGGNTGLTGVLTGLLVKMQGPKIVNSSASSQVFLPSYRKQEATEGGGDGAEGCHNLG